MFRLEEPYHLLVWIAIPILLGLFFLTFRQRQQKLKQLGNADMAARMMPYYSKFRSWGKFILILLAILFLGLAFANPQWGTKREKVQRKSSDVFIALDISNSMSVTDLAPSRLERAKKFARKLVDKLQGERVGIIVFAGNAYIHMPLTIDYSAASLFIDSANPGQILTQGTAIESAISVAELSFEQNNDQYKALIIISDGENHEPTAVSRAKEALNNGLLVFTVGAGTEQGGYIPIAFGGYSDYKRDQSGELVRSKLNEDMLKQVAEAGGGSYYNIISGEESVLNALEQSIGELEKQDFEQRMFDEYESYFWIFLIPGILLLIADYVISYRKSNLISGKDIFS